MPSGARRRKPRTTKHGPGSSARNRVAVSPGSAIPRPGKVHYQAITEQALLIIKAVITATAWAVAAAGGRFCGKIAGPQGHPPVELRVEPRAAKDSSARSVSRWPCAVSNHRRRRALGIELRRRSSGGSGAEPKAEAAKHDQRQRVDATIAEFQMRIAREPGQDAHRTG